MGIRYYAYAFDADLTALALADPRSFISDDPLADAWGMPHGAQTATPTFVQSVPKTEMLYLDKAWSALQALSAPERPGDAPRPAYRMFEGQVTVTERGWIPWVRTLPPEVVIEIAGDLAELAKSIGDVPGPSRDADDVRGFLASAAEFVSQTASRGRGFVYMIG